MDTKHIRNFSIIAHIDHGKSTLADRMLEMTGTVPKRQMREQVLDTMDLERERGITIKMQPVRMRYTRPGGEIYVLNLIDTPGHIDFSYEVSRALKAVEGAILLVDATQGVQAQTLSVLSMAQDLGLVIIPAISKIDSPLARPDEVGEEIINVMGCAPEDIVRVSGKTGEGVEALLCEIIERVPPPETPPKNERCPLKALVFDYEYSSHTGVIVYARIFDGVVKKGDELRFVAAGRKSGVLEVGTFMLGRKPAPEIGAGEIGYIITGIKEPGIASVGETITHAAHPANALPGYEHPKPVVWASVYPESQDDYPALKDALQKLSLSDSSFSFEEEASGTLGRGFRVGFLGMLHLEIVVERLKREFSLSLVVATPTILYEVEYKNGKKETIYSPALFPEHGEAARIREPWVSATIISPPEYVGGVMQILFEHGAETKETALFGDARMKIIAEMPLRELMRNFFDELKSATSGYGSLSYEQTGTRDADVVRLDILVAGDPVPAFARVVAEHQVYEEGKKAVKKLGDAMPRQMFAIKLQARALGRIIASEELSAFRKDVTAKLYGGDITRKMKLREKQKKGKKKMRERGKVNIPEDVFLKMVKS
ncbi:translation elongation factor 4 [bacterium]|nr:translation elongation factor 4 [bacterium]